MKVAICLFGVSRGIIRNQLVDYRKSLSNYRKYLFDYFLSKGYEIDIYLCTNKMDQEHLLELLEDYNPIQYSCIKNLEFNVHSRNQKITNVVHQVIESNHIYDHVCVTRFDLHFQKSFHESNINIEKFNVVSVLENPGAICDNFYLFPFSMIGPFYQTLVQCQMMWSHQIQRNIEDNIKEPIHFITDERTFVRYLTFYKIVRVMYNPNKIEMDIAQEMQHHYDA